MGRSPESKNRSAAALILAEAMERLELAQIPVCPDPGPAHSAAQLAHARACLGAKEEFDLLRAGVHGISAHGSRETRH